MDLSTPEKPNKNLNFNFLRYVQGTTIKLCNLVHNNIKNLANFSAFEIIQIIQKIQHRHR